MSSKYIPGAGYDDKSTKDVSPKKENISGVSAGQSNDSQWSKYFAMTSD